jgi:hypothetical protein
MDQYFKKVVIWGFPLHSHTHSYVHYGWYKAFKHLGYEVVWFHDKDFAPPATFNYKNCLFITEGYADDNIPLEPSSIYFVHVARNPLKYIQAGVRFIDIRYHVTSIRDCNYIYDTRYKTLEKIGDITLYEPFASDRDLHPQFRHVIPLQYEAAYVCWATDLLPEEIRMEDRFIQPEHKCYFIGSVGDGNRKELERLALGCYQRGVEIVVNNPWTNPLDFEEAKLLVQRSAIAPDIRGSGDPGNMMRGETGTCHKEIGYIPCRLFKNISYGKVGGTNCRRLYELFGDMVVYSEDEAQLAEMCFEKEKDKDYILKQMEWVRDHHTYVHRIQDLFTIIQKKPPREVSLVSG